MMNYLVIDADHIQIKYGILGGVSSFHTYQSGELESLKLKDKNMIITEIGELVPAYTETPRRKNNPSIELYKNGMIKTIMLEEQSEVITPIGEVPVERITFYPTGELHRIFITDGKISGFWSEEEEKKFNIPLSFEFDFSRFTACLSSINFYREGSIDSITLYPGESISIMTPVGEVNTGIGFSLFESGKLQTVEPKTPVVIETVIGQFTANDPDANGIHADDNSLKFDEHGRIISFKTVSNKVIIQTDNEFTIIKPMKRQYPFNDEELYTEAMEVRFDFDKDIVSFVTDEEKSYSIKETKFIIGTVETEKIGCSPADCASCSLCGSASIKI